MVEGSESEKVSEPEKAPRLSSEARVLLYWSYAFKREGMPSIAESRPEAFEKMKEVMRELVAHGFVTPDAKPTPEKVAWLKAHGGAPPDELLARAVDDLLLRKET